MLRELTCVYISIVRLLLCPGNSYMNLMSIPVSCKYNDIVLKDRIVCHNYSPSRAIYPVPKGLAGDFVPPY